MSLTVVEFFLTATECGLDVTASGLAGCLGTISGLASRAARRIGSIAT